jgi:hypothetical protein
VVGDDRVRAVVEDGGKSGLAGGTPHLAETANALHPDGVV